MFQTLMNEKKACLMACGINACFLVIHIALLILFQCFRVTPMVWFNVGSVIFYACGLYVAYHGWLRTFVTLVHLEVVAHMVAAVCCVGWDSGFQISLVGTSILVYYAEYLGRRVGHKYAKALPMCIVSMLAYVGSYIYTWYHPARYPLPDRVSFWMQIGWGLVVFIITIVYLRGFVLLTTYSEEALNEQVMHDKLTGLPNRYYMTQYLDDLMTGQPEQYWAAMMDLDDFKKINDTYGHNCGDYVLRTMADLVRSSGLGAEVCRWGGEEFLLVGRLMKGDAAARDRLDRMRRLIGNYKFRYEKQDLHITVTIGMAAYQPGQTVDQWISAADAKLYQGKCSGKNQVVL